LLPSASTTRLTADIASKSEHGRGEGAVLMGAAVFQIMLISRPVPPQTVLNAYYYGLRVRV